MTQRDVHITHYVHHHSELKLIVVVIMDFTIRQYSEIRDELGRLHSLYLVLNWTRGFYGHTILGHQPLVCGCVKEVTVCTNRWL